MEGGRVTGMRTNKGNVTCEVFVNCAGQVKKIHNSMSTYLIKVMIFIQWARQLGELSNLIVNIPLHSMENIYIISKPFDGT